MKIKLFKDILKTKVESGELLYSQGRVYLFIFVISYLLTLGYCVFVEKSDGYLQTIIESIQWAILLFAAYVFGGKGVNAVKQVFKTKNNQSTTNPQSANTEESK